MWRLILLVLDPASVTIPAEGVEHCAGDPHEIVVCGRHAGLERYRLPLGRDDPPTAGLPRAEWDVGGGVRAGIAATQAQLPQGASSQRIMVTVKIPF